MGFQSKIRTLLCCALVLLATPIFAQEGIVSAVTSAPIHPNGIVTNERSGLNIHLQSEAARGLDFMDPTVLGYGLPPGGSLEVEMISGFQRDPKIPLDHRSILLVVGTPQQGLPATMLGLSIKEEGDPYTFVIRSESSDGAKPEDLVSPAPGAAFDPVRARGIKVVHVGRNRAFVSRGEKGVVAVRFKDSEGKVTASGQAEVPFYAEPRPVIFPTNVPHDQRNHNWQRIPVQNIVGVSSNTLPIPLILYARNEGLDNQGIESVGVLSAQQLSEAGVKIPMSIRRYNGGLILRDTDGDGLLNPSRDEVIGGIMEEVPEGASGNQVLTPLVNEKPFLSVKTGLFNDRAGASIGGAIMQVVYVAGDIPGKYRITFALLQKPGDLNSSDGSSYTYTVVAE